MGLTSFSHHLVSSVVELSRIAYQEPELPLSQKKSEVILSKKMMLVGEVVNGGPLPNPPQHAPVCSFDSQNKFRGEGPMALPSSNQFKGISLTELKNVYFQVDMLRFVSKN